MSVHDRPYSDVQVEYVRRSRGIDVTKTRGSVIRRPKTSALVSAERIASLRDGDDTVLQSGGCRIAVCKSMRSAVLSGHKRYELSTSTRSRVNPLGFFLLRRRLRLAPVPAIRFQKCLCRQVVVLQQVRTDDQFACGSDLCAPDDVLMCGLIIPGASRSPDGACFEAHPASAALRFVRSVYGSFALACDWMQNFGRSRASFRENRR